MNSSYESEEMSQSDFHLFKQLIYNEAGIHLADSKITLLSNRIRKRLKALNIGSFHNYYKYLKSSEDHEVEIVNMLDAVTTNVSSFFRNPKQFTAFREKVMPLILERNSQRRGLKILSAGCATGEEPYTISIVLNEHFSKELQDWTVWIEAMDICTEALKKAEAGIYKTEKISEDVDEAIVRKYFKKLDDDTYQIMPELKKRVLFRKFNLKQDEFSSSYDAIFCRNVVIYFDDETKDRIYQKFYHALGTNGYFLVGPTEGILNDQRFKYVSPGIYRKNPEPKDLL